MTAVAPPRLGVSAPAATSPLRAFAERHRLRVVRDELGDPIVPGRFGQLYAWNDERLCVMIFGERVTARIWNRRRRVCLAVGMELLQNGDAEGTLQFDPTDRRQARAAIKAVAPKRRRVLSAAQRAALEKARAASPVMRQRGFPALESTISAQPYPDEVGRG